MAGEGVGGPLQLLRGVEMPRPVQHGGQHPADAQADLVAPLAADRGGAGRIPFAETQHRFVRVLSGFAVVEQQKGERAGDQIAVEILPGFVEGAAVVDAPVRAVEVRVAHKALRQREFHIAADDLQLRLVALAQLRQVRPVMDVARMDVRHPGEHLARGGHEERPSGGRHFKFAPAQLRVAGGHVPAVTAGGEQPPDPEVVVRSGPRSDGFLLRQPFDADTVQGNSRLRNPLEGRGIEFDDLAVFRRGEDGGGRTLLAELLHLDSSVLRSNQI